MSKIKPMDLIGSLHGKVCSHSDTYFAVRNNTQYTGKICHPRTKPYTEEELDRQAKFKAAHDAAIVRKSDSTYTDADMAKFKAQKKYKTFLGYLTGVAYKNTTKENQSGIWTTSWGE